MPDCRVYWGSHGCDLERGHTGGHECDCCDCPDGHHDGITAPTLVGETNVVCVARAPYYGPETNFYGEDVPAHGAGGRGGAVMDEPRSAQRYLEDLTPGGSEYFNNPKRCYEWAQGRIEAAHRIAMEAALERNRLRREAGRLKAALEPLEAWTSHAISVMKDRRLVSLDQIEDGEAILELVREALATADPQPAPTTGRSEG